MEEQHWPEGLEDQDGPFPTCQCSKCRALRQAMRVEASPRPWRANPNWPASGYGREPSPILDANDSGVLLPSEWLTASDADIKLIVAAVNAYN